MNRREFLSLGKDRNDSAALSCELLYMRRLDSTVDGTTAQFFDDIEQSLSKVNLLLLTDVSWLKCEELKPMESILAAFRKRGGRIQYQREK